MPPKLLLADDSVTVQRVIALTFAGEGLEVITVGDGDQAVERIAAEQPEIVLADVSMPGRDGYGVAEFVKRSAEHASRTRVVLLTGAFEPVDEARTRALGIDGVLAKPFEPQMAIGLVKRVLEQAPLPLAGGDQAGADGAPVSEGAWAQTPAAQSALGTGSGMAAGYPFEPGNERKGGGAELDDYFRRLDEALATAGLQTAGEASTFGQLEPAAGAPIEPMHEPESRNPEAPMIEPTNLAAPSAFEEPLTVILPPPDEAVFGRETAAAPPAGGTLVDAFSALLAVEQGEPGAVAPAWPAAASTAAAPVDADALVDRITRQVLERLTDAAVREAVNTRVLDVAERLVREEIERIKAFAQD
jgi:CheY-like chemotaxis protein